MKIKTLIKKQNKYIFDQLGGVPTYKISEKYSSEEISIPLVQNILCNNFNNGSDMKSVLCLFDTLIKASNIDKKNGLYILSTPMKKWVKTIKKVNVKSSEGYVYISDIISKNIQVVLKTSKKETEFNDLLREYFIGITEINKLRYIVPNFVYTLGAFLYPQGENKAAFVAYEYIQGDTLAKVLKDDKLSFEQYINIFVQILLALEIAQRKCSFCHYDLHINNIILRPITNSLTYSVVIDDKRYDIIAEKYIPVILDFGTTTIKTNGKTIGSYYFSNYGMMNYLIHGADMYKLLFHSYIHASDNLQRQIGQLFLFYGNHDPYNILILSNEKLRLVSREYVKNISFSYAATYIPLEFIKWIIDNGVIGTSSVSIKDRDIYRPIKECLTSDFFHGDNEDILNDCINKSDSYITLKYIQTILTKYGKNISTTKINKILHNNKERLIKQDKEMLVQFKNIQLPDEIAIRDNINQILNYTINKSCNKHLIEKFISDASFISKIAPYLQLLYTIREMKLEHIYKCFIDDFIISDQYIFYTKLVLHIEKTRRWSTTLLESIF